MQTVRRISNEILGVKELERQWLGQQAGYLWSEGGV